MKFEHQISEGTYHTYHRAWDRRTLFLYCFYCTTLNFERKLPHTGTIGWLAPAEEDTIMSRDRFRPMGARQNLALYYKKKV